MWPDAAESCTTLACWQQQGTCWEICCRDFYCVKFLQRLELYILQDHARLVLESVADAVVKRLADSVDAVEQSSDSQVACSLDNASQELGEHLYNCCIRTALAGPRHFNLALISTAGCRFALYEMLHGRQVLWFWGAGSAGSNIGYAVAAALLRAERLQLQSNTLASSQPFSDATTRILQAGVPPVLLVCYCE
jgi:hypothetical protein